MTAIGTFVLSSLVAAGSLAALAIAEPGPSPRELVGYATAADGDTIHVGATRVRLYGIDAAEAAQTCRDARRRSYACGAASAAALERILARDPYVTCQSKASDRYHRIVAVCRNSEGDLSARMVSIGWAVAYRRYSTAYVDQEAAAKAEQLGMWAGEFDAPERWRRENMR